MSAVSAIVRSRLLLLFVLVGCSSSPSGGDAGCPTPGPLSGGDSVPPQGGVCPPGHCYLCLELDLPASCPDEYCSSTISSEDCHMACEGIDAAGD